MHTSFLPVSVTLHVSRTTVGTMISEIVCLFVVDLKKFFSVPHNAPRCFGQGTFVVRL